MDYIINLILAIVVFFLLWSFLPDICYFFAWAWKNCVGKKSS